MTNLHRRWSRWLAVWALTLIVSDCANAQTEPLDVAIRGGALLGAASDAGIVQTVTASEHTTGAVHSAFATEIDRPPSRFAEYEMDSGRLSNLPVSWFFSGAVAVPAGQTLMLRALCDAADTSAGRCDTAMLASFASHSYFNDNDPAPTQHGNAAKGSFIQLPAFTEARNANVYVWSRIRATSRTSISYSVDAGVSWTTLANATSIEVGGTWVRVGPMLQGDTLEVQTRSNGALQDDTQLVVFNTSDDPARPATLLDDRSNNDRDPRFAVSNQSWALPDNYALLGKTVALTTSNRAVETRVDLVHSPLSVIGNASLTACNGPCPANLQPGQYLVYVFGAITAPVGAYDTAAASQHLSGRMPVLGADGCPNNARDGLGDATWFRGRPNDLALTLTVQRLTNNTWLTVSSRDVLRGSFGTASGAGWNKLALPLTVDAPGTYRVTTTAHVAGISFFEDWRHERNPEASDIKVVSYNTLFVSESFNTNKYKNLANLLGTRGSIIPNERRVEERPDQAPFQWESDVVALQEVIKGADDNTPDNKYTDVVQAELRLRSPLGWSFAQGRGETWLGGLSDGPGMNPIFINSGIYPSTGVFFSAAAKSQAGCSDNGGLAYFAECHLSERGYGSGDTTNYATAAKLVAWRNASTEDRPIAVFNLHMEASDGPKDFAPRVGEIESLMAIIDKLLVAEHLAFNRAPESATDKSHPQQYQNRMIILGDWNIRAHECGEHYWMIRKLREHFGYALDVAMATSLADTMHTGTSGYGNDEVPIGYQHMWTSDPRTPAAWHAWRDAPDHSQTSAFPWWATDWRNKTSHSDQPGERLSMIVLVGRGWAYDDPVLNYSIMSDSNFRSPMNPLGNGVEMYRDSDCAATGSVSSSSLGYAPSYSLGCDSSPNGGTRPGAPALHSDHRPMAARLRVWSR